MPKGVALTARPMVAGSVRNASTRRGGSAGLPKRSIKVRKPMIAMMVDRRATPRGRPPAVTAFSESSLGKVPDDAPHIRTRAVSHHGVPPGNGKSFRPVSEGDARGSLVGGEPRRHIRHRKVLQTDARAVEERDLVG